MLGDPVALREAFERDGYVICRGLFDTAAPPVRALLARQVEAKYQALLAIRPGAAPHRGASLQRRWALLAADLLADESVDRGEAEALVRAGAWGRREMLSPEVHALYRTPALLALVRALLGPEITANGDYHFRPAVSPDLGVPWGYSHHQESHYYQGTVDPGGTLQVLSLWLPLVDVDETSGCLSLVRGSHRHGLLPWCGWG
jgi:hypothetical protein